MPERPRADPGSDEEAVRECLAGRTEAFDGLVRKYQDRILTTIRRIVGHREDARDLAQEVFLRAFSRLATFRDGARFSTWLYAIALNQARSELRRRKARKNRPPVSLDARGRDGERTPEPADAADPPGEELGRRELHRLALRAIERLPAAAREVVVLRDMQGLSYEEIAEITGVPVGTVRSRLHRAREALRRELSPLVMGTEREGKA